MFKFNITAQVNQYISVSGKEYSRLIAYDICHKQFVKAIKAQVFDYDNLALHLYSFLASYGMVCRKSILLQHNYKFLVDVVKIVCDSKYTYLLDIDIFSNSFALQDYIVGLLELKDKISKVLSSEKQISDTLTSKIILGALGCVPGYDRYVITSMRKLHICSKFSAKGLQDLLNFTKKYELEISSVQKKYSSQGIDYSVMKYIDCALWNH